MRAILAAALLAFAAPALAQTLLTGFISRHSTCCHRESNPGVGLRWDDGDLAGWAVGTYVNSFDRRSWYLAREWTTGEGPVRFGVLLGLATGYRLAVAPMTIPEVVFRSGQFELALMGQPLRNVPGGAVLALQGRWALK